MKRWDEFWHVPVASVRPYLLVKGLMLLLVMDTWLLLAPRSAVYGFGGFNVAHFGWLDAVGPSPSPALYGSVQLLIGLLALLLFLMPLNRIVAAAICVLWTYGWSMSRLDNDPHHYLISSMLFCVAMFPAVGGGEGPACVAAWAYKLLGATMAIVYVWMSVATCRSAWLSNESPQTVGLASVIVIELLIATGYLAAVGQVGKSRRTTRLLLGVGLLAVVLQTGFAAHRLESGLLRYCITLTACVFFMPEKWLCAVRRFVDRVLSPLEFLFQQSQRVLPDLWPCAPTVVMAVIVAAVLGLCGRAIGMPGALAAGSIAGGALVATAIHAAIRNAPQVAARYNIAACIAGLAMWLVISASPAQFDHHMLRGNQLLEMGRPDDALSAFEAAGRFVGRPARQRGDYHMRTAAALQAVGRFDDAEAHLRAAAEWTPDSAQIQFNLGHVMLLRGQSSPAVAHLRRAIEIDPPFAAAHLGLGNALLKQGHCREAQAAFETATRLKPGYAEAYYNLGNVFYSKAEFTKAIQQFQLALQFDPRLASAHNNLGNAFYRQGSVGDAETHYRQAVRLEPKLANAHFNLGNICFRRGDYAAALQYYEDALFIDPCYADARHNLSQARAKIERAGQLQ